MARPGAVNYLQLKFRYPGPSHVQQRFINKSWEFAVPPGFDVSETQINYYFDRVQGPEYYNDDGSLVISYMNRGVQETYIIYYMGLITEIFVSHRDFKITARRYEISIKGRVSEVFDLTRLLMKMQSLLD